MSNGHKSQTRQPLMTQKESHFFSAFLTVMQEEVTAVKLNIGRPWRMMGFGCYGDNITQISPQERESY